MKNSAIIAIASLFLFGSCSTYTGSGALDGAYLGSILGSAIGGISNGARGSDVGTIIGMAGGAVIGASIAAQKEQQDRGQLHERYEQIQRNKAEGMNPYAATSPSLDNSNCEQSGFDATNSGDDRIYDFTNSEYTGDYSAVPPTSVIPSESSVEDLVRAYQYAPHIEIRNARFVDDNEDGVLSAGEMGKLIFEIMNRGEETLFDVQPSVLETTDNKYIYISPSIHVESIAPGDGIRYTALVKADKRLKSGTATFAVTVLQGQRSISKVTEFNVQTRKR